MLQPVIEIDYTHLVKEAQTRLACADWKEVLIGSWRMNRWPSCLEMIRPDLNHMFETCGVSIVYRNGRVK